MAAIEGVSEFYWNSQNNSPMTTLLWTLNIPTMVMNSIELNIISIGLDFDAENSPNICKIAKER